MLDLETMGTRPGCPVVAIGAVTFTPGTGLVGDKFYCTIDLKSCTEAGLQIDAGTVLWWLSQEDAARAELTKEGSLPLKEALEQFRAWLPASNVSIWGYGATFDCPVLEGAYMAAKMPVPWSYRAPMCLRTLLNMTGVRVEMKKGVKHNALDDAIAQVDAAHRAYQKLGLAYPF